MSKKLTQVLDEKVFEFESLFQNGLLESLKRYIKYPVKLLVRKIQARLFKNFYFVTKTKTFFGYPMYIHSFEYSLWFCGFLGGPELDLERYLIKYLQNGVFLDIGSHHGFYSLLAHKITDEDKTEIHAFEPTDTHFAILNKNTRNFKNIINIKKALCNSVGTKIFYESLKGKSTIERDFFKNVPNSKPSDFKEVSVTCTKLDAYCVQKGIVPTFMKIDVEGSEFEVLKGATEILKKFDPEIAMEVWSKPYDNKSHVSAVNLLKENGYKAFRIDSFGDITEILYADLINSLEVAGNSANYIFKK